MRSGRATLFSFGILVHQFSACTNPPSTKRHSSSLCPQEPGRIPLLTDPRHSRIHQRPRGIQVACAGRIPCSPILAMHESTIHQEAFKQLVLRAALPCSPSTTRHSSSLCSGQPGQPFLVHQCSASVSLSPSLPLSLSLSLYGMHSACAGSTTNSLARAAPPSSCRSQRCRRRPRPPLPSLPLSLSLSLPLSPSLSPSHARVKGLCDFGLGLSGSNHSLATS